MNVCYDSCPKEAGQLVPRTPAARSPPFELKKKRERKGKMSDHIRSAEVGGWVGRNRNQCGCANRAVMCIPERVRERVARS